MVFTDRPANHIETEIQQADSEKKGSQREKKAFWSIAIKNLNI